MERGQADSSGTGSGKYGSSTATTLHEELEDSSPALHMMQSNRQPWRQEQGELLKAVGPLPNCKAQPYRSAGWTGMCAVGACGWRLGRMCIDTVCMGATT